MNKDYIPNRIYHISSGSYMEKYNGPPITNDLGGGCFSTTNTGDYISMKGVMTQEFLKANPQEWRNEKWG